VNIFKKPHGAEIISNAWDLFPSPCEMQLLSVKR